MLQRGVIKLKFSNCRLGIEAPQGILPFLSQSAKVIAWKMTQLLLMANWTWLHYRYCKSSYLQSHSSWQRYRIWQCIKQGSQILHSIVVSFPEERSPGASAKAKQIPHRGLYGESAVATIFTESLFLFFKAVYQHYKHLQNKSRFEKAFCGGPSTAKGLRFDVPLLGNHKEQQLSITTLYKIQSLFCCHTEGTLVNVVALVRMWQLKVEL